jgi:hypothetical protein
MKQPKRIATLTSRPIPPDAIEIHIATGIHENNVRQFHHQPNRAGMHGQYCVSTMRSTVLGCLVVDEV